MTTARLFHNPRCSKSRAALDLIQSRGIDVDIVDYLASPPSPAELRDLIRSLGMRPSGLLRTGEPECASLGLTATDVDDDALIDAMCTHPTLIERPIFIRAGRAVIGRPPERVLDLLD